MRRVARWMMIGACATILAAEVVVAQEPGAVAEVPSTSAASPLLPPDHWAVAAARRAEALGLAPGFLPAQRAVDRAAVGWALHQAAERASERSPRVAELARGWHERFLEEYPEVGVPADAPPVQMLGSAAWLGYVHTSGAAAPGLGAFAPERTGARPLEDESGATGGAMLAAGIGSHLSITAEPVLGPTGLDRREWDVRAGWGPVAFSLGRQPIGYAYGVGGGVTLSGVVPLDRFAVETTRPVRLPGWFRILGPLSAHGFLSRMSADRHPGEPFFWGASGTIQPHPRVTLSVHRAALFGGERSALPITFGNVARMLIGTVRGGSFEDQVVSGSIRFRAPTEALVPLTAYAEWGSEDAAGAVRDVPGIVVGLWMPAVPRVPQLAVGVERSYFGASCCGNPPWYRHGAFPGSWAGTERPLGHPLGGNGSELLVYAQAELMASHLRLDGRFFRRDRGAENLYVPGRSESSGAGLGAAWRIHPRADLQLSLFRELGSNWSEKDLRAGARIFF